MPSLSDMSVGNKYSFEVYPASVLGNNFRDVTLEAILRPEAATIYGADIVAMHARVYPSLEGQGVPNDPFEYPYILIRHPSGEYQVLGQPWIRQDTIEMSSGGRLVLTYEDRTHEDRERILMALSSNQLLPDDVQYQEDPS